MQPHSQFSFIRSIKCHLRKLPIYYVQYFHRIEPMSQGKHTLGTLLGIQQETRIEKSYPKKSLATKVCSTHIFSFYYSFLYLQDFFQELKGSEKARVGKLDLQYYF